MSCIEIGDLMLPQGFLSRMQLFTEGYSPNVMENDPSERGVLNLVQ